MKTFFVLSLLVTGFICNAQSKNPRLNRPDTTQKIMVVEAACGEELFNMEGNSCDLAIRINGKCYYVDGIGIDDCGDAHAADGFCNAIRKAEVQGKVVNNRFKATYFKLLAVPAKKQEP